MNRFLVAKSVIALMFFFIEAHYNDIILIQDT
ncbi:hypothetical protein GGC03_23055 (plasmid) [Vibrio sp. THAF191c]|nr:hypothetical protein FIU99_17390 [Vibrio sp. THAF64]QGM37322.1 hypothetical protein GGC04_23835 [Vibrio sp. THAF191d]QGN72663.1 hypothetical protein GGC03_23055 [Vibrio sp. THAF191c]